MDEEEETAVATDEACLEDELSIRLVAFPFVAAEPPSDPILLAIREMGSLLVVLAAVAAAPEALATDTPAVLVVGRTGLTLR